MVLRVPSAFLERFWRYVYHSIALDVRPWGHPAAIVVEPICTFDLVGDELMSCRSIDEWLEPTFDAAALRGLIVAGVEEASGSALEQTLRSLAPGVYELDDSPLVYPGQRHASFVERFVTGRSSLDFAGICHFHPTGDARHSEADLDTFGRVAEITRAAGGPGLRSLIVARDRPADLIARAGLSESDFIRQLLAEPDQVRLKCRFFRSEGAIESIDVALV